MKRSFAVILLGLSCLSSAGCLSLAETSLSARDISYPVSMSRSIVDGAGHLYTPRADEKIAHFRREWRHWAMAWGVIPLTSAVDLQGVLEEEIERVAGSGIVNLKFHSHGSGLSWFISLLLIFPESVKVVVEGDVIRTETK